MNSVVAKMLDKVDELKEEFRRPAKKIGHESTPQKSRHPGQGFTHNHGKGESKIRKKMADKSRRINRKRNCR
jgi:hypothetical protein